MGEKLFTIEKKSLKIKEFEVASISACTIGENSLITYRAKDDGILSDGYDEDKCFATKHELLTYIEQPS